MEMAALAMEGRGSFECEAVETAMNGERSVAFPPRLRLDSLLDRRSACFPNRCCRGGSRAGVDQAGRGEDRRSDHYR